jgi:hypothetical protein
MKPIMMSNSTSEAIVEYSSLELNDFLISIQLLLLISILFPSPSVPVGSLKGVFPSFRCVLTIAKHRS